MSNDQGNDPLRYERHPDALARIALLKAVEALKSAHEVQRLTNYHNGNVLALIDAIDALRKALRS